MTPDEGSLTRRTLSACVFVPAVLAALWFGGWALFALVVLVVGRGTWELLHMARQAGHRPAVGVGVALALAWCLYLQLRGADEGLPLVVMGGAALALAASLRRGVEGYLANAMVTLGGLVYVAVLGATPLLLAPLLGAEAGWMMIALFACIWLTDTAAYFGGTRWGRRRLAPTISPGKTVAGFLCGLAGGLVPLALWPQLPSWSPLELGGLFLAVSAAGQVGDMVESAVKRDLGVKDAPVLIPGHGGMLDRFDSYLFAFPLAYAYTVVFRS